MKLPISIEAENGHYVAQVVGHPNYRAEGVNRDSALSQLENLLRQRMDTKELVYLDIEPSPKNELHDDGRAKPVFIELKANSVLDLFGIFKDDPDLMDICEEAYRLRDEERKREWGE